MSSSAAGSVVSIHVNVGHRQPLDAVETARFIGGQGIEGDRHATSKRDRRDYQVLLMESETLKALDLEAGGVRENVTTAGVDLTSLDRGQRLALGDQVVLRVSKPAEPCSRMDEIRSGLREALRGRRGMLASVEQGGSVAIGDSIAIL